MRIIRAVAGLVALAIGLVAFPGCGDDDDEAQPAETTTTTEAENPIGQGPPATGPGVSTASTLTAEGWGPIRIGMTVEEAQAAVGPAGWAYDDNDQYCNALKMAAVQDVDVILAGETQAEKRVVKIVSRNDLVRTDKGVGIGSTVAGLKAAYPTAAVGASEYATAMEVPGTPAHLEFVVDVESGQPIPAETTITSLAVTRTEEAQSEEICA